MPCRQQHKHLPLTSEVHRLHSMNGSVSECTYTIYNIKLGISFTAETIRLSTLSIINAKHSLDSSCSNVRICEVLYLKVEYLWVLDGLFDKTSNWKTFIFEKPLFVLHFID